MVLLISALATIGVTKRIFLDSGSPRGGGGVHACVGMAMVCYHSYSSHTKFLKVKTLFSLSLTAICAELCCQTT